MKNKKLKHQILAQWIVDQIENGVFQEDQRIPSENELTLQFGISRQTVRQAIGQLETNGYLIRMQGSGTYVQKPVCKRQSTKRIGVITTYLDDYIFPSIIYGIEKYLRTFEYSLVLGITHNRLDDEENALQQMLNDNVDGLIIEGTKSALPNLNMHLLGEFPKKCCPIVFINGYYRQFPANFVAMDDVKAGQILVSALLERGHTKIGCLLKSDDIQGIKRYEGIRKKLREYNITIDENAILWYTTEDLPRLFGEGQDRLILERFKDYSAIICYNDQIATDLLYLYQRNNYLVPDDVSVASFDNSYLAQPNLCNLTSVSYEGERVGSEAARLLLKKIEDPSIDTNIKIEPYLYIRDSIKSINK